MKWFGSSGIRGVAFDEFTLELAMRVGYAAGSRYGEVVIGRDSRLTGQLFSSAISAALMSVGADVIDAGMVPTPTLAYATRDRDCGVMVTASHNPPEYNGVKFWNPDGSSFGTGQMREIEDLMESPPEPADWKNVGDMVRKEDAVPQHLERILSQVQPSSVKVVVDCADGPASLITPKLLREMGCTVIAINSRPDGEFPGRPPEPTRENLQQLAETVVREGADLGIAHDGDADRMVAVDDKGRYAGGDLLLKLFVRSTNARRVVVPVDASMTLDDWLGDGLLRSRVGDAYISEKVKESGAEFGGEPSGTWIFPLVSLCPDGIFAAAKLVEICSGARLSEMIDELPELPMLKETYSFDASRRGDVLRSLEREVDRLGDVALDRTDGLRLQFDDGWGLVRLSGTEPKMRVVVEARSRERAKEIMSLVSDMARRCLS